MGAIFDKLIPDSICGKDSDDLFAYTAPKYVIIKDRRLGCLRLAFLLLIVIFIVGYQIIYLNGWFHSLCASLFLNGLLIVFDCAIPGFMLFLPVYGTTSITAQQPTVVEVSTGLPCDPLGPRRSSCSSNFSNMNTLNYCTQSSAFSANEKLNCTFWDGVRTTVSSTDAMFIATRVETQLQEHYASPESPAPVSRNTSCGCAGDRVENCGTFVVNGTRLANGTAGESYLCPYMWTSTEKRWENDSAHACPRSPCVHPRSQCT
jgi:hypothetical protein